MIEVIAQLCHEINKAYCESIGDHSQPSWENAPQWQKDSALQGVQYKMDNPDATPEAMHASWLAVKEADGWRYGPTKNPETKEHPCYVPYNELPIAQRTKDYLFSAVVTTGCKVFADQPGGVTKGMEAVDVSFNPGGNPLVNSIKLACAEAWDTVNDAVAAHLQSSDMRSAEAAGNIARLGALSKTSIEMASMQGVKAVTRK